jgi:hypothetical protein
MNRENGIIADEDIDKNIQLRSINMFGSGCFGFKQKKQMEVLQYLSTKRNILEFFGLKKLRANHIRAPKALKIKELSKILGTNENNACNICNNSKEIGAYIKCDEFVQWFNHFIGVPKRTFLDVIDAIDLGEILEDYRYKYAGYIRIKKGDCGPYNTFESINCGAVLNLSRGGFLIQHSLYDFIMGNVHSIKENYEGKKFGISDIYFMKNEVDNYIQNKERENA